MKEPVVCYSTCLIGLERIGALHILPALFEPILIPPEVEREFGSMIAWLHTENIMSNVVEQLKYTSNSANAMMKLRLT